MIHSLLHLLIVFLARHWFVGVVNAALTVGLGLALVQTARTCHLLTTQATVRLRRAVTLLALFKGALYLVLGLSLHTHANHWMIVGIQLPDPAETLGLKAQTKYSIWHPTALSEWLKLTLGGCAVALLAARALQLLLACRAVDGLLRIGMGAPDERSAALLQAAARNLPLRVSSHLPRLVCLTASALAASPRAQALPTPFLLGLRHPRLLIASDLAAQLTDEELEAVFRHELAHLVRGDHWGRWLQLAAEDIGRVTLLAGWLRGKAVDLEEQLCDRLAVRSSQDARVLGNALQKAAAFHARASAMRHDGGPAVPETPSLPPMLPVLLGGYAGRRRSPTSLTRRLEDLLSWSSELAARPAPEGRAGGSGGRQGKGRTFEDRIRFRGARLGLGLLRWTGWALFGLLLLFVLYVKLNVTMNPAWWQ